ncbi:MAG: hypothetical protein JW837_08915 [Sedimentisphaerales bacterium]|nr:hypothetical protein [Sedimentisphaerales bacterium]
MFNKECKYRRYCLIILLVLLGILSFAISFLLPEIELLLRGLGSFLFGAAIVDGLLTIRFQVNIENQVADLENSIKTQVETLDMSITTLQNTVMIASGAVESGLTAVYAERKICLEEIGENLTQIINNAKSAKESASEVEVKMLGISLGDFLCPHGILQPIFRELLKVNKCTIEIVILKDYSTSAYRRALREEEGKFNKTDIEKFNAKPLNPTGSFAKSYKATKCHDELKTATDYLKDLLNRKTIDKDSPNRDVEIGAKLEVFVYNYDPMTFLFMIENVMFVENYHLAGRGGEAPILSVAKLKRQSESDTSRLYEIYSGHFIAMKKLSEQININDNTIKQTPEPNNEGTTDTD